MSQYWLLSGEAFQKRLIREIREARSPLVARGRADAQSLRPLPVVAENGVATIRVEGLLSPAPDMQAELYGEPNTTYPELQAALSAAMADAKTREIVWSIDSPGGDVDGLFALLDDIADARASGQKPMRVEASNAHSAAYGIAAAVGNIAATSRVAAFGSVGVATSTFVQGGLCGKVVDITSSDAPDKRPNVETPEGREVVVRYMDQLASEFMGAIARGRGVTSEHVAAAYGRGSSMLATAALQAGLIDSIATRGGANGRTLTYARTSDTVRDRMADPTPAPAVAESPAVVAASPQALDIPVQVDLSELAQLSAAERAELAQLRADRDAREATELRGLVTDLVALGAETPATAFASGAPVTRLVSEGLPALRARVAALRATRPAASVPLTPPASAAGEDALEDFERRDAAKIKDPEARARFIAGRLARKQKAL